MSHLAPIYAAWDDNAEAMAADIGELGVTVRQWRNRDSIPPRYWPKIVEKALSCRGVRLDLSMFLRSEAA